jgi:hypothetical protein
MSRPYDLTPILRQVFAKIVYDLAQLSFERGTVG